MIRALRWPVLALFLLALAGSDLITAVGATPQTITFTSTPPPHGNVGGSYSAVATASSGLAVTLTVDPASTAVCSTGGGVVALVAAGICTIDANQPGNITYAAATMVQQSFTVYLAYSDSVLPLNPSGYWPLSDIGTTTATDLSGNSNPGTLVGGVVEGITPSVPPSPSTPGMSFDGSTGGIGTAAPASTSTSSWTLAGWVNESTLPTGQANFIVYDGTSSDGYGLAIGSVNDGGGSDPVVLIGDETWITSGTAIPTGWVFVAVTDSNGSYRFYINGVATPTSAMGSTNGYQTAATPTGTTTIGTGNGGDYMSGDLADIAVFSSALSAGDLAALNLGLKTQFVSFSSNAPTLASIGSTYTPSASATTGLPVVITVDPSASSICAISSGIVTFNALGVCVIDANQAGNSTYAPAVVAQQEVVVPNSYQSAVLSLAPTGFWPLSDVGTTTAVDLSGNGATGSLNGGVTENTGPGIPGLDAVPVMAFDGLSGNIATSAPVVSDVETISGWFKTNTSGVIWGASNNGGVLMVNGSGQVSFELYSGGRNYATSSQSYADGHWHFVAGVIDASGMFLYVDGVEVASNPANSWIPGGDVEVGYSGAGAVTGANFFDGSLADIAVFASALTADQIATVYTIDGTQQSVSFTSTPPGAVMVGGGTYTPTATATSGLAVSLTITTPLVCSMSAGVISFQATGACTIDANQAGSATFLPAPQVQQVVVVQTQYGSDILPLAPAGYWPLNDTDPPTNGEVAVDASGSDDNGTLHGGVSEDATPGIPALGGVPGMAFDGTSGFITTGAPMNSQVESVAGWFKTTTSGVIVGSDGSNTVLMVGSSGQVSFELYNGGRNYATSPLAYNDGQWHFAVGVVDSSGMTLYVDGSAVATNGNNGWNTGGQTEIGYSPAGAVTGNPYFDGTLADVATFSSALDSAAVSSLYLTLSGAQTVTFSSSAPRGAGPGQTYDPTASASSGGFVTFSSATTATCTVSGGVVTLIAAGTCTVTANQAGDAGYSPATAAQSFTIISVNISSSQFGPFGGSSITVTATATGPTTMSVGPSGGPTVETCVDVTTCSTVVSDPLGAGTSGNIGYAVDWGSDRASETSSTSVDVYWNAAPVASTAMADNIGGLFISPFGAEPTDQYCTDPAGASTPACTTASFVATDLNTGQTATATDTGGVLSGTIDYPPVAGYYGQQNYTVSETADGQTGTSAPTPVNSPLGYWTGSIGSTFFLAYNIPAPGGSQSFTYETVSDSPSGAPLQYSGIDQNNTGTCEAQEAQGAAYCGQYATSNVLFLQLWTSAGVFLGYTPTAGFSGPSALALFLEEVGLGNPAMSSPVLKFCKCGDPVNMSSGDLYQTYTDVTIPGIGINLNVTRSYNSLSAGLDGAFGNGWTSNLGMALSFNSSNTEATIADESGSLVTFTLANGVWSAPAFNSSTLTQAGGTWTYARWDGNAYTFDAAGQLASESDRNGNTTRFAYTGAELTSVTDATGRALTITWTGGNISQIAEPGGAKVSYAYNAAGDLIEVTNQAGGHTYYTYDASDRLLTVEDPNGDTTTNTYNSSGQVATQTDPMGRETLFAYSVPGASQTATLVTDANGNETYFLFDDGLLMQRTAGYGTSSAATTSYSYDPVTFGISSVTNPVGDTTAYTYDGAGNVLTRTGPRGDTTYYTYNSLNEPLTVTNAAGVTTTQTYDPAGNLLSTSTPLVGTGTSHRTTYAYGDSSDPGMPTRMVDPNGNATTYAYDTYGDLAASTNAAGDQTTYTYDILGQKLTMVSPDGNAVGANPADFTTAYSYNALGDILTTTTPGGGTTVNTYDGDGNVLTTTNPVGDETATSYNSDGEPTEVQYLGSGGSVLRTTYTGYDHDGNVTSTTDGMGNQTTYGYNVLNQQTSSTNPLGETTAYSYDGAGNLLSVLEPNGVTVSHSYDAGGELLATSYSDSTPSVGYSYDSLGQRTGMSDGTGDSFWAYNSLGQKTSYTNGAGAAMQYGYDLAGNQTSITYPGGDVVTRAFNNVNQLTSITDWNSQQSTFSYDANGNPTAENLANGVTNAYAYDPANNLVSISDAKGTTSVFSASYTRNANHLVTGDSSQPSTGSAYQYTGLSQVCYAASSNAASCASAPSGATAYAYAASGNLVVDNGTQQAFNAGDQLCWSMSGTSGNGCATPPTGATTYVYGANGTLTSVIPATGSASALSYNGANELTTFEVGSGPTTSYAYDGNGLRQSKTTGSATTQFTWNDSGALPVLLQETSGFSVTSYIYGPTGLPLAEILPGGSTYYYSQDNLGSTRVLTDSAGAIANTDTYDPYGNVTASTGSVQNNLLFCGQYMDAESGFYYLQARYYDPTTGQFLSVDPKVAATLSPYGYVNGNPLNGTDPSGDCGLWGGDTCWGDAAGLVNNIVHNNEFGWCVQASAGAAIGVSGSGCFVFNANGIGFTGTIGGQLTAGASAGVTTGPFVGIGARTPEDLGNIFGYAGASGGAGPAFDATIAGGTGQCGQPVTTIYVGGGLGVGISGQAGVSNTWVWQP